MCSFIKSSLCLYLNPVFLPDSRRASWATSFSISNMLHPHTLQPNTRIYKIPHISYRLSEKPNQATSLLKVYTPFTKNVTTKTRQGGHYLLTVTNPLLNRYMRNYLPHPLPLALSSMLLLAPHATKSSRPSLLTSCLPTVPVIRPT